MSESDIPFGRFELIERVGSGGMASVWSARHLRSGRLVAIKVIAESRAQDPRYRQAFQQEVEAVAGLSHPNVIEVYDYGGGA